MSDEINFNEQQILKEQPQQNNKKQKKTKYEANKELTRIKREYYEANGFSNYHMNYKQFMTNHYIPYYRTTVQDSTYLVREKSLLLISERFGNTKLRSISIEQVQSFRTWLLTSSEEGGAGYSQGYASLVFGLCF